MFYTQSAVLVFYTVHFHLYCFCSNIGISSLLFVTAPVLPFSTDWFCSHTPTLPFLVFLFQHLHFHFYCFFSHTSFSIFTVSTPTLALSSLQCQLPHLHSVISAVSAPRPTLPSPLLLFLLLHFSVFVPTSGRTSILFLLPDLHLQGVSKVRSDFFFT